MPTLHLISGLPASGKTTYATALRKRVNGVLFNLDRWLITAFGRYSLPEVGQDEHTRRVTVPSAGGARRIAVVVRDLDEVGVAIDDIAVRRPTLDDVFLALTGHAAEEADEPEAEPAGRTA